jgi:hypothetical protein
MYLLTRLVKRKKRRENMGGNEREYGDLVVLMERPPIPELR